MDTMYYKPCVICGEKDPALFKIWFDGYLKLYKCIKCGFVSQFPGPGRFTIVTDYQDRYPLDFLDQGQEFMYPNRRRCLQNIVDRVIDITPGKKILDVGCGDGHFLYLCSRKGFECSGVEDSKQLSGYASSKTGAKIVQGQYNKEMFPKNYFDIISFIQVLEHIPTPALALETARYHLRSGGILLVEVPSIHSPHFLLYAWTGIKRFVKPPDGVIYSHFGYYSPQTITALLVEKCGFKQISLVTGRWQYKYSGFLKMIGKVIDPLLAATKIGGILFVGEKID